MQAFNEFEVLYRHTKHLDDCSTPADVNLLKAVILSGSKLLMKFAEDHPELSAELATVVNTLSDQLDLIRDFSEPIIYPSDLLEVKNRMVSTFEYAIELVSRDS